MLCRAVRDPRPLIIRRARASAYSARPRRAVNRIRTACASCAFPAHCHANRRSCRRRRPVNVLRTMARTTIPISPVRDLRSALSPQTRSQRRKLFVLSIFLSFYIYFLFGALSFSVRVRFFVYSSLFFYFSSSTSLPFLFATLIIARILIPLLAWSLSSRSSFFAPVFVRSFFLSFCCFCVHVKKYIFIAYK